MILSDIKVFNWVKNKKLQFTSCCDNVAEIAGADSPMELNGKTDFDLIWKKRAEHYLDEETTALSGKKITQKQYQNTAHGSIIILVTKCPLYSRNGNIIGTVGSSIDITHLNLTEKNHHLGSNGCLYLGESFNHTYLTKREVAVFRKILYGLTNRRIAEELFISARTVEHHVNSIKRKLQCKTKGDVIYLAVTLGLTCLIN